LVEHLPLVASSREANVFKFRPVAAAAVAVLLFAVAPSAFADTIHPQGNTTGTRYHGGHSANGGISYAVGLQVAMNSAGQPVNVRAVGRISKLSKVSRVQVDSVVLGNSTSALVAKNVPVNSGTAVSTTSFTKWKALPAGACGLYRTRANFSIRWADGTAGKFSILSPLSQVCRSGAPPKPADRDCADFSTHAQAQAWFEYYYPYYGDFANLDGDNDGQACESLP
jgi:hypothetical protein